MGDHTQPTFEMCVEFTMMMTMMMLMTCVVAAVAVVIGNSEFTQQDGRKKRTAERSCVTNVTRLFLTCFVVIFT